jgi:hypothetical protein
MGVVLSARYDQAASRMMYWRRAQTVVLAVLVAGVPILYALSVPWEMHLPAYAGALAAYLFCESKRSRYRALARDIYESRV